VQTVPVQVLSLVDLPTFVAPGLSMGRIVIFFSLSFFGFGFIFSPYSIKIDTAKTFAFEFWHERRMESRTIQVQCKATLECPVVTSLEVSPFSSFSDSSYPSFGSLLELSPMSRPQKPPLKNKKCHGIILFRMSRRCSGYGWGSWCARLVAHPPSFQAEVRKGRLQNAYSGPALAGPDRR
jgi:hypothetical protein